jgi:leucine dehydrogenase
MTFEHEQATITTGVRSGLTVIVALHSTALGNGFGGCRLWRYED